MVTFYRIDCVNVKEKLIKTMLITGKEKLYRMYKQTNHTTYCVVGQRRAQYIDISAVRKYIVAAG